jgi:carbamoyl-phosphate synthase small subunit
MNGLLYLSDGTIYEGKGFGAIGTALGELVFNTSLTGYQEILTDPSYAGQIITMTYPLIGNYGVNRFEDESTKVYAKGFVVKSPSNTPSNYLSEDTIDYMLKKMNVVGVYGLDTRSITKRVRSSGTMKCIISNENLSKDQLEEYLYGRVLEENYVKQVSTKKPIHIEGSGHKVVVIDFGAKANIIQNLKHRNCDITILPYDTSYSEIEKIKPEGVLLSNGPGDPKDIKECLQDIRKIMKNYPTFGICLGHQMMALAVGGDTYKMKYGHRGGNHGVYDVDKDRAYITSQNHGYAVDLESIKDKMVITHINLNDNTVEGMRHKELPIFSVQFHPEGAPGPQDSAYLFDKFIKSMDI